MNEQAGHRVNMAGARRPEPWTPPPCGNRRAGSPHRRRRRGTAGWMAAALLAKMLPRRVRISLVESQANGSGSWARIAA